MWRRKTFEQSIVVLGAGFAGIECARRLYKKLKRQKNTHIALVDKENYSVFQPLLAEVAAASIEASHVVNPVRMFVPKVDFDCAEVERVDLEERKIYFQTPEGFSSMPMPFTHLVIALGQLPNMGLIPGVAAHGLAMKTVGDAYHLRNHIIYQLEQAANTSDEELREELLTFVTVGAGFSGVETCAEVHDMVRAALKYYPELKGVSMRSVLVSGSERILPQMSPKLSAYSLKKLRSRGIEVLLKGRVTSVTPSLCFLKDGTTIKTRTVVTTIGNSPHPLLKKLGLPFKWGRIQTDADMRVQGHQNIWAIGDCALITNAHDNEPSPATAQFATRQGAQCAANIVNVLEKKPTKPFSFKQLGYLASLGHLSAVCEMFGFLRFGGIFAWWMWRTIYLWKLPGWYRKLRVVIDWTISLFFPRDICQIEAKRSDRLARQHYEPGQEIIREGDKGDTFFSIVNGEVEVVAEGPDGEKQIARLGPGSYFGEEALLTNKPRSATVRAWTTVDVLCLGRSDFVALADNLKLLGDTFKKARTPLPSLNTNEKSGVRQELQKLFVQSIMSEKPVTIKQNDDLLTICRVFQDHSHDFFPVLDEKNKLVGELSRHDLYEALRLGSDKSMQASKILSHSLVTVNPEDDLNSTLERFHQHQVDHMYVVSKQDSHVLMGILSLTDILKAYIEVELALQKESLPVPDTSQTVSP